MLLSLCLSEFVFFQDNCGVWWWYLLRCFIKWLSTGISCAGIVVLVALFFWDNKKEEEQLVQISRDETLSRLPLRLSTNRVVELVQLRDTVRPVSIYVLLIFSLSLVSTTCWTFSFCLVFTCLFLSLFLLFFSFLGGGGSCYDWNISSVLGFEA